MPKRSNKTKKQVTLKYLHRRIQSQLIIFTIIAVVVFGIMITDVYGGKIGVVLAGLGVLIGLLVGFVVGRIFAMTWHAPTEKVIMSMDKMGFVLIVAYVLFRTFSKQIFGEWIHGEALAVFTLCILGGIMVGRLLSMVRNITKILREQAIV